MSLTNTIGEAAGKGGCGSTFFNVPVHRLIQDLGRLRRSTVRHVEETGTLETCRHSNRDRCFVDFRVHQRRWKQLPVFPTVAKCVVLYLSESRPMPKFIAVALEGDFCSRLDKIVRACGRQPVGKVRMLGDSSSVAPLVRQPGHIAAVRSGDWTILIDDWDLTSDLFDNPAIGTKIASLYKTRVVSAFGVSTTGDFGYRVHGPDGLRSVLINEQGTVLDEGEPMPGEDPIEPDDFSEESVLSVLDLLGIDIADGVELSTQCALVELSPKSDA